VCHSKRSCAYEPRSWDFIVIVNRKTWRKDAARKTKA
jgi:hypothetical protein